MNKLMPRGTHNCHNMAQMKFNIVEDKATRVSTVTITLTDLDPDKMTDWLRGIFELEMLTAEVVKKNDTVRISFKSGNYERCTMLRQELTKFYFNHTEGGKNEN